MSQPRHLLKLAERIERRVEQIQEDDRAVITHEQPAITGGVTLTADFIQTMQQRHQSFEVLETNHIRVDDFLPHRQHIMTREYAGRKLSLD